MSIEPAPGQPRHSALCQPPSMPVSESSSSSAESIVAPAAAPSSAQHDSSGGSKWRQASNHDDAGSEKDSNASSGEEQTAGRVKQAVEQVEHKQQQQQTSSSVSFKIGAPSQSRDAKLLFASARDVVRASLSPRSKASKAAALSGTETPKGSSAVVAPIRTAFGKFRRSSTLTGSNASTRALPGDGSRFAKPVDATSSTASRQQEQQQQQQQPLQHNATNESSPPLAPMNTPSATKSRSMAPLKVDTSPSQPENDDSAGRGFVDEVRRLLDEVVPLLDSVDPRKLIAIRLGGELRGLLGKAQDEFCAYESSFAEHAAHVGVSIALQNFAASLHQVFGLATRLQAAKFLLNKTFKREVTFAFQEINSYYTSLFMELSMAVARRSGIELPLPSPVKLQPPSPVVEPAAMTTAEAAVQTEDQQSPGMCHRLAVVVVGGGGAHVIAMTKRRASHLGQRPHLSGGALALLRSRCHSGPSQGARAVPDGSGAGEHPSHDVSWAHVHGR